MKFVKLLLKNLFRNKLRTLLTVSSIAASIFLVAVLISLLEGLTSPPETPDSALRLITRHRISLFNTLPVAYRERIAAVEGVEGVIGSMWFGGVFDNKGVDQMLAQFAVDIDQFFIVNPDMVLSEEEKKAFLEDRGGAIVGNAVADMFGWKVGDHIHTKSNLWPVEPLELIVHGIYEGGGDQGGSIFFHWQYFYEAVVKGGTGDAFTGTFSIRARSADDVPLIAERVDALFKNSSEPTKTETEQAFILGFFTMLGNVQLLISGICLAILFAVVLVAANTMAMSIRERVREIGIMKALGFRRRHVLTLLLLESMLLALLGSVLGAGLAGLLLARANLMVISGGMVPNLTIGVEIVALCAAIGVLVGLVAAGIPAFRAASRPVVEAIGK